MKVVIDIDREDYEKLRRIDDKFLSDAEIAIANGTPLPDKHGRLIDADYALNLYKPSNVSNKQWFETTLAKTIIESPTIVEENKGD